MSRRTLESRIVRLYPYPLAMAWVRAGSMAATPAERVAAASGALELVLRLLSAVALQDYLRGAPEAEVEGLLARPLSHLSLGQWLRLVRETFRATLRRPGPPPFARSLSEAFGDGGRLVAAFHRLVEERNRSHGHSGQLSGPEQERASEALLEGLAGVLDECAPLGEHRLISVVSEARLRRGNVTGKVRCYNGRLLESEPTRAEWEGPLVRDALYLVAPDGASALELSPLLALRLDPGTRREALFLWAGADDDGRRLRLRNDDTGHEERGPVVVDGHERSFARWLEERGSRDPLVHLGRTQGLSTQLPPGIPVAALESLSKRFELIEPLGEGGMSIVWRVRDRVTGETSALKILQRDWSDDVSLRERFLREAALLQGVAHPHVVPVEELLSWPDGGLALRMPVMEGGSTRGRAAGLPVAEETVRRWLVQALDALAHLHERGVVHRDVKPENLLLDVEGRLRLADFGIALGAQDLRLTLTRESLGTLGYIAPEQLRGARAGPPADIYALGIVAHEWLTGQLPEGAAGKGIAGALGAMLGEMTRQEPDDRPDARSLLARLGARATAPQAVPPSKAHAGSWRRRRAVVAALTTATALGVGFGLFAIAPRAQCGDGVVAGGERCDDGNRVDSDLCSNRCEPNARFLHGVGPDEHRWFLGSRTPCTSHAACRLELPATPVLISPFWLAKTETTLETFVAWAPKAGLTLSPELRARAGKAPLLPAADVTFRDAQRLCRALGGRLPSEAEWEYAARSGGREQDYPWGDGPLDCDHAILGDHRCSLGRPWPVCSKPLGNNADGLCDLSGNVWEWVVPSFDTPAADDLVRPYPGLAAAPAGANYTLPGYFDSLPGPQPIRGGGHWQTVDFWMRARSRYAMPEGASQGNIGFRCAFDADTLPLPEELLPVKPGAQENP